MFGCEESELVLHVTALWSLALCSSSNDKWYLSPPLFFFFFSFQIGCYAAMKKKIYAMGGGSYGKLFESVECYDPRTQQWTAICPLKERR